MLELKALQIKKLDIDIYLFCAGGSHTTTRERLGLTAKRRKGRRPRMDVGRSSAARRWPKRGDIQKIERSIPLRPFVREE